MSKEHFLQEATNSRTPAQWLQEMCNQQDSVPKWDVSDASMALNTDSTINDSDIGANPIGDLNHFCEKFKFGPPVYNMDAGSYGPPHDRCFSVECKIGNESKTEWSKTKRQAKRRVAHKWLLALHDGTTLLFPDPLQKGKDENRNSINALCDAVKDLKLNNQFSGPSCSGSMEECLKVVSHQNHSFRKLTGERITKLKEGDMSGMANDPVQCVQYLEDMAIESNFTLKYTDHKIPNSANHSTIILLTLGFAKDVQIVLFGLGSTPEMARADAAQNVLRHIQTVAR